MHNLTLAFGFEISRNSDRDDIDNEKSRLLRAFDEATYSPVPVKFEVWKKPEKPERSQYTLPFLPAEASTNVKTTPGESSWNN